MQRWVLACLCLEVETILRPWGKKVLGGSWHAGELVVVQVLQEREAGPQLHPELALEHGGEEEEEVVVWGGRAGWVEGSKESGCLGVSQQSSGQGTGAALRWASPLGFASLPVSPFSLGTLLLLSDVIECGTLPPLQELPVAAVLLFTTKCGTCSWLWAETSSLDPKVS